MAPIIPSLRFVKGAIARKDYQPALTHFLIKDGRVRGFNGIIALSSPIDLDILAVPQAKPFVDAIERCKDDTTVVYLTPGGKLGLRSGNFRAHIECLTDSGVLEGVVPEGVEISVGKQFMEAMEALEPYIGFDASKSWATGILLRGQSAYATNNIIVAEYWIGEDMPEVNIPEACVRELLRIKLVPEHIQLAENSITFHYKGDRWMRSQLLSPVWPDVNSLLDRVPLDDLQPVPKGLFDSIELLMAFVGDEGRVYFRDGRISTSPHEDEGASFEVPGVPDQGAYHHKMLMLLKDRITGIRFEAAPNPSPFQGPRLRGMVIGMIDQ